VSSLMLPPLHVVLAFWGIALCLFQSRENVYDQYSRP